MMENNSTTGFTVSVLKMQHPTHAGETGPVSLIQVFHIRTNVILLK